MEPPRSPPAELDAHALRVELLPHVPRAPDPLPNPRRPRYVLAALLFVLSFFSTTTLGAVWFVMSRTDMTIELTMPLPLLTLGMIRQVWTDPALLRLGLQFSLPALFILLCHEMGHYLVCRRYRVPATLPYFLPAPFGLGTLGAFIRIRAPIRSKRELFDVGVAGPLAGFAALLPFLLYGVAHSAPAAIEPARIIDQSTMVLVVPGRSLAIELATRLFHGELPAGTILDLHPFALAAWFGLLATALNLIPLGQLDGGHILYAVVGRWQRPVALGLWLGLVAASFIWTGWTLWCILVLVMGLRHPPVRDETTPLDGRRRLVALLAVLLLVLSFMPQPVEELLIDGNPPRGGVVATLD